MLTVFVISSFIFDLHTMDKSALNTIISALECSGHGSALPISLIFVFLYLLCY
jgi:hypothetical protein